MESRRRRLSLHSNGSIQIDKRLHYVDEKLAVQTILLHLDAQQRCLHISLNGKRLTKVLPLKGLHDGSLDLQDYLGVLREEAMSIAQRRAMLWMQSGEAA